MSVAVAVVAGVLIEPTSYYQQYNQRNQPIELLKHGTCSLSVLVNTMQRQRSDSRVLISVECSDGSRKPRWLQGRHGSEAYSLGMWPVMTSDLNHRYPASVIDAPAELRLSLGSHSVSSLLAEHESPIVSVARR